MLFITIRKYTLFKIYTYIFLTSYTCPPPHALSLLIPWIVISNKSILFNLFAQFSNFQIIFAKFKIQKLQINYSTAGSAMLDVINNNTIN
jgi:hypothetical protein